MTIEIIVLAMASTIRPTSLAAIHTLLAHQSRRTLLLAYVLAGLSFTIAFGLVVVYAMHGIHIDAGTHRTKAIAEIIGGAVALALGLALLTGRIAPHAREAPEAESRLRVMLSGHVSTRTAMLAGPATHIPGIFYLIALNIIVAHDPRIARGTIAVGIYNAVWFALPIVALVTCILRPDAARGVVDVADRWARAHSRTLLLSVSLLVGAVLVVRGALAL